MAGLGQVVRVGAESTKRAVISLHRARALLLGQDTELVGEMGKKAHATAAVWTVLAWLSPIAVWMEPALENPVSELTRISLLTNTCKSESYTSDHVKINCSLPAHSTLVQ